MDSRKAITGEEVHLLYWTVWILWRSSQGRGYTFCNCIWILTCNTSIPNCYHAEMPCLTGLAEIVFGCTSDSGHLHGSDRSTVLTSGACPTRVDMSKTLPDSTMSELRWFRTTHCLSDAGFKVCESYLFRNCPQCLLLCHLPVLETLIKACDRAVPPHRADPQPHLHY